MKEIKPINFHLIEINFQYKNELITIKSEPFKTLENAIIKALKKMINVPTSDLHCFYLGIDITRNKNKRVGDLFYRSEKVNIKLKPKDKKEDKFSLSLSSDKYKYINKSSLSISSKNMEENNSLKELITKNKKEIKPPSIDAYNNLKKNIISSISKNLKKNKKIMFLEEKNNFISPLISDNRRALPPLIKSIFNSSKTSNKFLCKCGKNKIANYCKDCKILQCNNCINNEKHKNHSIIHLNEYNYVQDIINYGKNAQEDIINNLNINKTLLEKVNIMPINSLLNEKEKTIQKYQKMLDKYSIIVNKIEKYLYKKENEERFKLEINNYNKVLNKVSNEVKDYMNNVKNKNININNLEMILNDLNSKEEMIYYFNKDMLKYYLINEINIKIKSTMKSIEKIIDDLNCKDNCFNLGNKYYDELINMKIIERPKIKKEEKDKRKSIIIGGYEISKNALSKRRRSIFSVQNKQDNE